MKTRLRSTPNKAKSAGFTIIELVVAIAIIGILAATMTSTMSTDRAKVTSIIDTSAQIKASLARFNADTGCYPHKLDALFVQADATGTAADVGFCTSSVTAAWRELYLDSTGYNAATNGLLSTQFGPSSEITTGYDAVSGTYFLNISNIPTTILNKAVNQCNNAAATATPTSAWGNGVACIVNGTNYQYQFAHT